MGETIENIEQVEEVIDVRSTKPFLAIGLSLILFGYGLALLMDDFGLSNVFFILTGAGTLLGTMILSFVTNWGR
jgi:hypothetical protein